MASEQGREIHLSEDWIKARLGLEGERLDNVKGLSLPGTYHEKIASLSRSLRRFTRLKELDLSRNCLSSLDGLENLTLLENLNLYYNQISSLEELKRLQRNSQLRKLDLRLNPVTKQEPDYRMHLIYLLPNLQELDDRPIRDSERKEAQRFLGGGHNLQNLEVDCRSPLPVGDFPNRNSPHVKEYGKKELNSVVREEASSWENRAQLSSGNHRSNTQYEQQVNGTQDYCSFTPCPKKFVSPPNRRTVDFSSDSGTMEHNGNIQRSNAERFEWVRNTPIAENAPRMESSERRGIHDLDFKASETHFANQVINLVEQSWEGSGSLRENPKFISLLKSTFRDYTRKLVSETGRKINQLEQEVSRLNVENLQLVENANTERNAIDADFSTLKNKLHQAEDNFARVDSKKKVLEKAKKQIDEELIAAKHRINELSLQLKTNKLSQAPPRTEYYSAPPAARNGIDYDHLNESIRSLQENQSALIKTNEQLRSELSLIRSQQMLSLMKDPNFSHSIIQQSH